MMGHRDMADKLMDIPRYRMACSRHAGRMHADGAARLPQAAPALRARDETAS